MKAHLKPFLFHLPLIGLVLILGFFVLVDAGVVMSFRNEATFGWMLLVWYPLGAFLGLVQIAIWIGWIVKRLGKQRYPDQRAKGLRIAYVGFAIVMALALGLFLFRMAQRWGFFE